MSATFYLCWQVFLWANWRSAGTPRSTSIFIKRLDRYTAFHFYNDITNDTYVTPSWILSLTCVSASCVTRATDTGRTNDELTWTLFADVRPRLYSPHWVLKSIVGVMLWCPGLGRANCPQTTMNNKWHANRRRIDPNHSVECQQLV